MKVTLLVALLHVPFLASGALAQAEASAASTEQRQDSPAADSALLYVRDPAVSNCPDEPTLRAELEARLGHGLPPWRGSPVVVVVHVARFAERLRATVWTRVTQGDAAGGVRVLEGDLDCALLGSELSLVVALAFAAGLPMDSAATEVSHAEAGSPVPSGLVPQAAASSMRLSSPTASLDAGRNIRNGVFFELAGGAGLRAGLVAHGEIAFGVRRDLWTVALAGRIDVPRASDDPGIDVQLTSLAVRGCRWLEGRGLELGLCVGLASGMLRATTNDDPLDRRSGVSIWVEAVARAEAYVDVTSSLAIGTTLELGAPLTTTAVLGNAGVAFRTPSAVARAALSLRVGMW